MERAWEKHHSEFTIGQTSITYDAGMAESMSVHININEASKSKYNWSINRTISTHWWMQRKVDR